MIRQAHTYLAGAMGGATLIAIAIAVFVVLVSAQVFRDWPIAALGDGGSKAAVSAAEPAPAAVDAAARQSAGGAASAADTPGPRVGGAGSGGAGEGRSLAVDGGVDSTSGEAPTPVQGDPGAAGGGDSGNQAAPGGSAAGPATSGPGTGTGTVSSGAGSGGKSTAGAGSGSAGTPAAPTTTGQVTETVNNTVNQVDESVLGGTLDKAGVTETTEGVVNGAVGPESTVGKVVDETVGAVGGLLHPNR